MQVSFISIPCCHRIDTDSILTEENGETLINITSENPRIIFEPKYYNSGIVGSVKDCYVRESVYQRLLSALEFLPEGYGFKIFDAWRPYAVQKFLFDKQVDYLCVSEGLDINTAQEQAKKFVSFPVKDSSVPFVHSTGGAVDLTVIDNNRKELNMGTGFDDFTDSTATDYFEKTLNDEIKNNRRLLYSVMIKAGFTNYPSEWWHYDYGDAFWAAENGSGIAFFGGIFEL